MEGTKLTHNSCPNKAPSEFYKYYDGVNRRIGMQCKICSFEWLSGRYVKSGNVAEEEIIFEGMKYHLYTNPIYFDPDYRINKQHVELQCSEGLDGKLNKGDHICYKPNGWKGYVIIHHAIIADVKRGNERTKFDLIHWNREEGADFRAIIYETDVDLSSKTDCVMLFEYGKEHLGVTDVQLTLARAKALIGKAGYHLLNQNCEHFATFCKIGSFHSWQVCYALKKVNTAVCEIVCSAVKVAGTKTVAKLAFNIVDDAVIGVVKGGKPFLGAAMQGIGFGIVVVIHGLYFTINVTKLYKEKQDGKLTDMEFKGKLWRQIMSTLEGIFFTGGIPVAGALILGLFNPCTAVVIGGVFVAAVLGGALTTYANGFGHTLMGRMMSHCTRPIILYESLLVASVNEVSPGDHIVITKWLFHPRCHAIVVDVVTDEDALVVIRFTYERGVVREKIKFKTPTYKVLYKKGTSFDSEKVMNRAEDKFRSNKLVYDILLNNCKSFARWCTTGKLPYSYMITGRFDGSINEYSSGNQRQFENEEENTHFL